MDKRERPIYKGIFFSEQEWQQVATKMAESDMPNFSAFCREMLLTGKVKHYDFSVIKEISSSLSHISGNINQVAKRCNTNQSVTNNDVEQLRREYLQLKSLYQERLVKALRKLVLYVCSEILCKPQSCLSQAACENGYLFLSVIDDFHPALSVNLHLFLT